jgi:hypothetical protein
MKQASLSANGDLNRAQLAREFLELVNGLSFLPTDALALEISLALDNLLAAHSDWNNFSNESSHARILQNLVPASGNVPDSVVAKYVRILTMCRIGNGYGVSWIGQPIYDELIGRWQDKHITTFISLVRDAEVASRLDLSKCARNYQNLTARLDTQATNPPVKRALSFLAGFPTVSLGKAGYDSRLVEMLRQLGVSLR